MAIEQTNEYPVTSLCFNCEIKRCQLCIAASLHIENFIKKPENHCGCFASNPNGHVEKSIKTTRKPLIQPKDQLGSSHLALINKPIMENDD
jgi:predicted transcriptional regulator YheO